MLGNFQERKSFPVGAKPRHRPFKRSLPLPKAPNKRRSFDSLTLAQDDKAREGPSAAFPLGKTGPLRRACGTMSER